MKALILVDLQYDFLPGGALAVPQGDQVISIANDWMPRFELVVATQDWHPLNHQSFASRHADKQIGDLIELKGLEQVLWPDHCVQGTPGAELHADLDTDRITRVFQKGTDIYVDSYSGFFNNCHQHSTGLAEYLKERAVNEVSIMGLATDYCVKYTALDAIKLGLKTSLILEGCRGVNLNPGDVQRACEEMQAAGVKHI
ncbi:bifunctional nicotinamidase/pyrazinamidase [uncultured Gimesia sp.]|uniref:bifunctional nicotinamidase/pyrazinamidase n=1 Tax=uncultured Gimesia sp. TaxID=1678688 RepID=UPI0030D879C0|tara:strand:- start:320872 stop:321468 length:597 start_codon:yes stop_codon:yes gene_type:complete